MFAMVKNGETLKDSDYMCDVDVMDEVCTSIHTVQL